MDATDVMRSINIASLTQARWRQSVETLERMASHKSETPVSGDALAYVRGKHRATVSFRAGVLSS